MVFGFIYPKTFFLRDITYSTNSVLSSSISIVSRFCNSSSLVSGLIIVEHSLSLKNFLRCFLTSFLLSLPFSTSALSRYSLELISLPCSSHNYKAKSLTTHIKDGMQLTNSSIFSLSSLLACDDLN